MTVGDEPEPLPDDDDAPKPKSKSKSKRRAVDDDEPESAAGESPLDKLGPHATKIMIGAAVIGAISLFLPAVTVSILGVSESVAGWRGWQGKLGLVCYIAVGVMAGLLLSKPDPASEKKFGLPSLITAGVAVLMALLLYFDVSKSTGGVAELGGGVSVGIGAYLNILASLVLVAGSVVLAKRAKVF